MCCQITTPGRSVQTPTTPNFRNRKIPRFDRNNLIKSCGQKHVIKLLCTFSLCGRRVKFVESPKIKVFKNYHHMRSVLDKKPVGWYLSMAPRCTPIFQAYLENIIYFFRIWHDQNIRQEILVHQRGCKGTVSVISSEPENARF